MIDVKYKIANMPRSTFTFWRSEAILYAMGCGPKLPTKRMDARLWHVRSLILGAHQCIENSETYRSHPDARARVDVALGKLEKLIADLRAHKSTNQWHLPMLDEIERLLALSL